MKQNKEYTPQHISDKITQDLIDALLRKGEEFKKETKVLNPYSLEPTQPIFLEAGFKHGVKPAPPATKKLKQAATSMFEFEMMRTIGEDIEIPQVVSSTYVPIKIHGKAGGYYIRTSMLRNLMNNFIYESHVRSCPGGQCLIATFEINTKLLIENCIRRK